MFPVRTIVVVEVDVPADTGVVNSDSHTAVDPDVLIGADKFGPGSLIAARPFLLVRQVRRACISLSNSYGCCCETWRCKPSTGPSRQIPCLVILCWLKTIHFLQK